MLRAFQNEPFTDFTNPKEVQAFREALEKVRAELGQSYPLHLNGEALWLDETFESINPARPSEVVGRFPLASADHARRAIEQAHAAFLEWRYTPAEERARYLITAAAEMRRRRHEFSAWMVFEVGKSWVEADVDTAEAIDFLEYYARQILALADSSDKLSPYPGEQLNLQYIGMGTALVIPPWNFANAIVIGMTSAALVGGNSVVLKPAEQSPTVAYKIAELFWQQHLPAGVLNFITGDPQVIGDVMVDHPKTRLIAFTGSREVGLRINERAAKVHPGQIWIKRAVLEMGGKDAVLVDETADLAAAAEGIAISAFGFQGQKCSAGSRAIIVQSVYEQVTELLIQRVQKMTVGATDLGPEVYMGPVIDEDSVRKIMSYIAHGRQHYPLLHGGEAIESDSNGYFIAPTVFGNVPPHDKLAQEEIFGPVLALIPAQDFEEAIRIFNGTEYGLTGSIYSRDRRRLERARRELHVGNLYFNRKSTGALVGVHPFGGFNMSGTDSKAGGPDYLLLFTQAKSIAEKL